VPRLRRRLAPGGFLRRRGRIEDPHFDPATVVHHWALPTPAGRQELAVCTAVLLASPLQRDQPLWQLHVLGLLADGGVALGAKILHALGDGLRAVELGLLFDDLAPCGAHARVS
jgi:diacylglycerol O-acyltransferase